MERETTIHGFRLRGPLRLEGRGSSRPGGRVVAVSVARGAPEPARGRVLATVQDEAAGRRYTLVERTTGWRMAFAGTATVDVSPGLDRIDVVAAPHVPDGLLSVLVAGPVAVALAALDGRAVLHASAVVTAPSGTGPLPAAAAVVGPRGSGKSTVARLLADTGWALFSDDALALARHDRTWLVDRGTTSSRLRGCLTVPGQGRPVATSADGRLLVSEDRKVPDRAELALILRPVLSRDFSQVRCAPLPGGRALLALVGAPALDGMVAHELMTAHFEVASRAAMEIPVLELRVPWPAKAPSRGLGERLREIVEPWLRPAGGAAGVSA